jgi:hypothetical protein
MILVENILIKYNDDTILRVLYINSITKIVYVINVEKERMPYAVSEDELNLSIENSDAEIIEDSYCRVASEETLKELEKIARDCAWEVISFLITNAPTEYIFISKYRSEAIQKAATKFELSKNTIKNYLLKYWKGGKTKNALLPNFFFCGGKGKERVSSTSIKRGRPSSNNLRKGINVDDKIKKIFKTGLNKFYYTDKRASLRTTYEMIIKNSFVKEYRIQNGVKIPVLFDSSEIPTYSQFLYWYRKFNNTKKEITTRIGGRVYQQNYRTIIGSSTKDAELGPGSLWQIDSTLTDCYLVSSISRKNVVGRGVIFTVIDVYSRLIMGIGVSFEPFNSYIGCMSALINSMIDKNEFCSRYGVETTEEFAPPCVPQRIIADRGELNNKKIENAILNLGISIQNCPPYRADYKGVIEQGFRQLNLKIKGLVDGMVSNSKNVLERGEKNYRLEANLTIEEFTRILIKCVIFYNNHHVISSYISDEMALEDDVPKVPMKIWEHGLKTKKGVLRVLPEDMIKLSLFPSEKGVVTEKGVLFRRMLYSSNYALKNNWFRRKQARWEVKISYDPRDLAHIYVLDESTNSYHKLILVEHLSKYAGKSIEEIECINNYEDNLNKEYQQQELQQKVKLLGEIEEIVETAKQKSEDEKDKTLSKSQRLKGIKENNRRERELHREAVKIGDKDEKGNNKIIEEKEYDDDLWLFKQLQAENGSEEYE